MRRGSVVGCRMCGMCGMVCLAVILGGAGLEAVQAQESGLEQAIQAPLLDITHARRAHRQVEDWLRQGQPAVQAAPPMEVTGLFGVRITLRTRGFVIGHGQAYRADLTGAVDKPGPPVDLMRLLAQATRQAMEGVNQSLADTQLKALLQGRVTFGMKEPTLAKVSGRILVELELGYDLKTIHLPPDALEGRVYTRFAPGYHGLGFAGAQPGVLAWVWPGEAIARNISPTSQLTLGLKRAGYDRERLPDIARPEGPGMLRFETLHLVRPVIDLDPTPLVRGKADLPGFAVTERALESMGDRLFEHLGNRFTLQDQIRGTFHPTSGKHDPPVARHDQIALTCYAITHYCRYLTSARPDDASIKAIAERALKVAAELGDRLEESGNRAPPQALALVLLTLLETPVADADKAMRDRLGQKLVAIAQAEPEVGGRARKKAADALVLAALATLYDQTRDPRVGSAVALLTDRAWVGDHGPDPSSLPWLILADERVGGLLVESDDSGRRAALRDRRREIIVKIIDRLCQRQVIERPGLGPQDVLGGFVLSTHPPGSPDPPGFPDLFDGPPNPDWHNAQPLIFLAAALRDETITRGNDKFGWLLSAGLSARFIGQLMMDETSCYYVKDTAAAMGGVRMAPWDNRLALAPSAMSLIAITELQTTLASLRPVIEATTRESPDGL